MLINDGLFFAKGTLMGIASNLLVSDRRELMIGVEGYPTRALLMNGRGAFALPNQNDIFADSASWLESFGTRKISENFPPDAGSDALGG